MGSGNSVARKLAFWMTFYLPNVSFSFERFLQFKSFIVQIVGKSFFCFSGKPFILCLFPAVKMTTYDSSIVFISAINTLPTTEDTICNDVLFEGISAYLSSSYAEAYKVNEKHKTTITAFTLLL